MKSIVPSLKTTIMRQHSKFITNHLKKRISEDTWTGEITWSSVSQIFFPCRHVSNTLKQEPEKEISSRCDILINFIRECPEWGTCVRHAIYSYVRRKSSRMGEVIHNFPSTPAEKVNLVLNMVKKEKEKVSGCLKEGDIALVCGLSHLFDVDGTKLATLIATRINSLDDPTHQFHLVVPVIFFTATPTTPTQTSTPT
eukprot:TRINITY_DN6781_c0_g2_i6.p1 TRINITY_DN6781_c0_g2~~TRINITY_DN6781_c0_g2_i6.p1  ORF type:complete len:197 (-),score=40.93 TRINITY_DN6781_c0_g2_i6:344-934(-)